jgi:hypothetical protein
MQISYNPRGSLASILLCCFRENLVLKWSPLVIKRVREKKCQVSPESTEVVAEWIMSWEAVAFAFCRQIVNLDDFVRLA